MSTVTPPPLTPTPDPDRDPRHELIRLIFGDHSPVVWILIYLVIVLAFALGMIWILAPYLGQLQGLLWGGGGSLLLGGGGAGLIHGIRRRRRDADDNEDS